MGGKKGSREVTREAKQGVCRKQCIWMRRQSNISEILLIGGRKWLEEAVSIKFFFYMIADDSDLIHHRTAESVGIDYIRG